MESRESGVCRLAGHVAVLTMAAALAACGGDDGGVTSGSADGAPEAEGSDGEAPASGDGALTEPVREGDTVTVNAEIHFQGFRIVVEEARADVDGETKEPVIVIDAVAENLRDEGTNFPVDELDLQWAGETAGAEVAEHEAVRPGRTARIELAFPVDPSFTFADAALYAGSPDVIQPAIPLSDPDATVTAAPVSLEPPQAPGRDGALEVEVTEMALRASDRWNVIAEQQPVDQPVLELMVDIRRTDADATYGAPIADGNFRIQRPDGTEMAADNALNGLLEPGEVVRDQPVTFVLDDVPLDAGDLPSGEYVLLVSSRSPAWDDDPEVQVPFTLTPSE